MKKLWYGVFISLMFAVVCFFTLSHYGLNEDSPGHFFRGQTYLNKLTTGQDTFNIPTFQSPYLFAPGQRISMYKFNVYESELSPLRPIVNREGFATRQKAHAEFEKQYGRHTYYKHNAWGMNYWLNNDGAHPPISDMLEALSNKIFYEKLGITGDVEGYYVYVVITAAVAIFSVFYFTLQVWGIEAALFAAISLALYPLFFGESHFNIKDISELSYFTLTIVSFYFWFYTKKKRWMFLVFISFFLGVGTKLNILFVPIILLLWLVTVFRTKEFKHWFSWKVIVALMGAGFVELILFIILWPYLWDAPFSKIVEILVFSKITSSTNSLLQQSSPFLRSILYVITMTPFVTLVFFLLGIVDAFKKRSEKERKAFWLVLIWFLIPLARVVRPGADIFESTRQYLEFLPAMMILAGIGGSYVIEFLSKKFHQISNIKIIIGGIYIGYLAAIIIMYHPNENVFFNILAGGTKGAMNSHLMGWQTPYDNPYRQAAVWLNAHAEPNSKIAYLDGTMVALSPIWLRDDIYFGSYFSGLKQNGEYVVSIVYPDEPPVFPYLYLKRFLNPVYEVKAGGQTILYIWKNSPEFVKKTINYKVISGPFIPRYGSDQKGNYWEVSLSASEKVVSVQLQTKAQQCALLSGLWKLDDYILPYRVGLDDKTVDIYFPASQTQTIRYYNVSSENCFSKAQVQYVTVLQ